MSSSSDEFTHKQENSKPDVSLGFRWPYLCPGKGHQHGVSISLRCSRPTHLQSYQELLSYTEGLKRLRLISDKQLHLFQYVSSASIFQNSLPLTLRYNLADFSSWIHSGVFQKGPVATTTRVFMGCICIKRTRLDRLVFRVIRITTPQHNAIILIPQDEMTKQRLVGLIPTQSNQNWVLRSFESKQMNQNMSQISLIKMSRKQ